MTEIKRYLSPEAFQAIGGRKDISGRTLSTLNDLPENGKVIFPKDLLDFLERKSGNLAIDVRGGVIAITKLK